MCCFPSETTAIKKPPCFDADYTALALLQSTECSSQTTIRLYKRAEWIGGKKVKKDQTIRWAVECVDEKVGGCCHCHRLGQSEGSWAIDVLIQSLQWTPCCRGNGCWGNSTWARHKEVAAATKRKSPLIDWRIGHVDSPVVGGMRCITLELRHFTQAHTRWWCQFSWDFLFFSKCSHKVDLFRQGVDTHTRTVQSSRFNFRVSNFPSVGNGETKAIRVEMRQWKQQIKSKQSSWMERLNKHPPWQAASFWRFE